jgi:hypothetical protein
MQLKVVCVFVMMFFSLILNGQSDFRTGYVITNFGDTIFGNIDYRGDKFMGRKCSFLTEKNVVLEYTPYDISAFRFQDSKYFVSKELDGKLVFMEYLIKGIVNVYYLRSSEGDNFYVERNGEPLSLLPFEEGIRYKDKKYEFYETKKHIGFLIYYMSDAPQIKKEIERIKKPDHLNLIKLAEDYHNAVCFDEECVIYERTTPFLKLSVEPYWELKRYSNNFINYFSESDIGPITSNFNELGLNLRFWMPRYNEKIFFLTGMSYSENTLYKSNSEILKFPIQVQYLYPADRIKPIGSFGINYYNVFHDDLKGIYRTFCLNGGINCPIAGPLSVNFKVCTELTPLLDLVLSQEMEIISYSFNVGFNVDL